MLEPAFWSQWHAAECGGCIASDSIVDPESETMVKAVVRERMTANE